MDRRRLAIAGMWVAALGAIAAIYFTLEPAREDGRTREGGEAPTFVAGEHVVEGPSRLGLAVEEDPGDIGHYRGGPRHTGRSRFRGPASAHRAWRYEIGARISAQPVVGPDGTIYVGAHDRNVHAVAPDGTARWTARAHHRVWSAAAVVGDTVYVGSDADAFFALDAASGQTRWRVRADGDADGAPSVRGDRVFFSAGPHLYAITRAGELAWRFQARGPFLLSSPAIDADGTLYLGSIDDHLYAIAPEGRMRWAYAAAGDISSSPVIGDDGLVFFGSDDAHVHAVDRDGARRWMAHVDGYVRAAVALGRRDDVIAAVYGPRPRVVSLDAASGELRWFFPVNLTESPETGVASGPLVDRDGNIYFGAHDDYLYALSADGALRWIHPLGGDVDSAPVLSADGVLLVGCDDGFLYAIVDAPAGEIDAGQTEASGAPEAFGAPEASDTDPIDEP
ncbi:MAG: PQQ-like beta-propeller repeat protein [Sandaracinaceae bacterium]|nr:PQQ-like beta-propeller repeat protein [Sandaracinaceae bacterium]